MSRKKAHHHEEHVDESWLIPYADILTLLLALFIVMFAVSQVDAEKFAQMAHSLRSAFGESSDSRYIAPSVGSSNSIINLEASAPSPVIAAELEKEKMAEIQETVEKVIEGKGIKGDVTVTMEERGIKISINSKLLFQSGNDEIEPNSKPTIQEIGESLLLLPGNHIRVEGHTDSDPISNGLFASNWELSAARSTKVLRYLIEKSGINPKIISAVGYGQHYPLLPNTTYENKARNRRVDIVILKKLFDKQEVKSLE